MTSPFRSLRVPGCHYPSVTVNVSSAQVRSWPTQEAAAAAADVHGVRADPDDKSEGVRMLGTGHQLSYPHFYVSGLVGFCRHPGAARLATPCPLKCEFSLVHSVCVSTPCVVTDDRQ